MAHAAAGSAAASGPCRAVARPRVSARRARRSPSPPCLLLTLEHILQFSFLQVSPAPSDLRAFEEEDAGCLPGAAACLWCRGQQNSLQDTAVHDARPIPVDHEGAVADGTNHSLLRDRAATQVFVCFQPHARPTLSCVVCLVSSASSWPQCWLSLERCGTTKGL